MGTVTFWLAVDVTHLLIGMRGSRLPLAPDHY